MQKTTRVTRNLQEFWDIPYMLMSPFISRLMPDYQRYIETCGEVSSKWGLRLQIKHFLTEENADEPDLLKFNDRWTTDANTLLDNKAPPGNRTAPVSVSGTRFPNVATSSTKRIVRVSTPFFNVKTGEYILRLLRRVLLGLFQRKCAKVRPQPGREIIDVPRNLVEKKKGKKNRD